MPTPFEQTRKDPSNVPGREWAARSDQTRRSIFSNFKTGVKAEEPVQAQTVFPFYVGRTKVESPTAIHQQANRALQDSISLSLARSFLYQFLARAFDDPTSEIWVWLTSSITRAAFQSAIRLLTGDLGDLDKTGQALLARFGTPDFDSFQSAYVTAFGHAARGDCPLNEIEYGELKADPLFQPHRLADLAAFYRAFGLEVADDSAERPDHIGMELEFMSMLASKESYAHEHQLEDEKINLCLEAQKKFLREHLGRWAPAFARRLARVTTDETLAALAQFTVAFLSSERVRFGFTVENDDLRLRPVDEAAESLCASCGLQNPPPGVSFSPGSH